MEKVLKRKKSPSKSLIVFIEGKIVDGKNATAVFVNAIKKIGPAKIAGLNKFTIDGLPLVVPKKDYRMQMNTLGKQWYVCTHLSTMGKKSLLERIGKSLKMKIVVEVKERSEQIIYDKT